MAAKHDLPDKDIEGALKKARPDIEPHLRQLEQIQAQLGEYDQECAEEQMKVVKEMDARQLEAQKKYDAKKLPDFVRRQEIIENIPEFWGTALLNHPDLCLVDAKQKSIINQFLKKVELEDNLDANGSYKLTMTFDPAASATFTPTTLSKSIIFADDEGVDPTTSGTGITFVDTETGDIDKIRSDGTESLLHWFLEKSLSAALAERIVDLGEIVRRDIFHNPLSLYLGFVDDLVGLVSDDELGDDGIEVG